MGPIGTLDQDVRQKGGDQLAGSVLFKKGHGIHGGQGLDQFGPFIFGDERPAGSLYATDAGIGIQGQNQNVAEGSGLFQQTNMTRMKEIVTTVGKDDGLTRLFPAAALGEEIRAVVDACH